MVDHWHGLELVVLQVKRGQLVDVIKPPVGNGGQIVLGKIHLQCRGACIAGSDEVATGVLTAKHHAQ